MIGTFDKYSEFHQKETCQKQSVNTCKSHTDVLCENYRDVLCENYRSFGNDNHIYDVNGHKTCLRHAGPALQRESLNTSQIHSKYTIFGDFMNFFKTTVVMKHVHSIF